MTGMIVTDCVSYTSEQNKAQPCIFDKQIQNHPIHLHFMHVQVPDLTRQTTKR